MPTVVNAAVVDSTVNRGGTDMYIYIHMIYVLLQSQLLPMMPVVLSLAVKIFLLILLSLLPLQLLHAAVTDVVDGGEGGGGGGGSCGGGCC